MVLIGGVQLADQRGYGQPIVTQVTSSFLWNLCLACNINIWDDAHICGRNDAGGAVGHRLVGDGMCGKQLARGEPPGSTSDVSFAFISGREAVERTVARTYSPWRC